MFRWVAAVVTIIVGALPGFPVGDVSDLDQGMFLVAGVDLTDPNFKWTVVLLLEYDAHGALGLVINRPTETRLGDVLPEVDALRKSDATAFVGGPVQVDRVMTLYRSDEALDDSHHVFADIYATSSRGLLQRLSGAGRGETSLRVYMGYAGWSPGQLDREVERGDWHVIPADPEVVFGEGSTRIWRDLIPGRPGDWTRLAPYSGRLTRTGSAGCGSSSTPCCSSSSRATSTAFSSCGS